MIFNAPHVDRITGTMQITQTRFGRFNVLLTFSRPNIRPPKKKHRVPVAGFPIHEVAKARIETSSCPGALYIFYMCLSSYIVLCFFGK